MREMQVRIAVAASLLAATACAGAQTRKAGLWELTTTMTWQQSPFPGGMPGGANGPQTTQVCLTQAMIDKYGAIMPTSRNGCQFTDIVMKPGGMSGVMACTGTMSGKGTVESSSTDGIHATGSVHFTGSVKAGPNPLPVEWTSKSSAAFKSADCGSVKPPPMLAQ
jgi:hypothetical protein